VNTAAVGCKFNLIVSKALGNSFSGYGVTAFTGRRFICYISAVIRSVKGGFYIWQVFYVFITDNAAFNFVFRNILKRYVAVVRLFAVITACSAYFKGYGTLCYGKHIFNRKAVGSCSARHT